MHFVLRNPREFAKMAERCGDVRRRRRLAWIAGDFANTFQHRTDFRQHAKRLVGALWKIESLVCAEKAIDEAVKLLLSHERKLRQPLARDRHVDARQTERRRPFLVTAEPISEAHHQGTNQFVGGIQRIERRQLAAPQS